MVAQTLYTELTGATAAQFYQGDRTIDIVMRLSDDDRDNLEKVRNLPIYLGQYGYVPLEQIAKISYRAEDGVIWRRDLKPTILFVVVFIKEQPMMQLKKYIIN